MKKIIASSHKIFILFSFFLSSAIMASSLNFGNTTQDYDAIFLKIGELRTGIKDKKIDKIKNPFVVVYKKRVDTNKTKKPKIIYRLNAIFNNTAMINKKWYKRYAKIGIYKLVKIKKNSVILRRAKKRKELFIRKKNESSIKFSSKQ